MSTALTLTPLFRQSIGFDRFNDIFEAALRGEDQNSGYPPYNIEKLGSDHYRITMAVAGFTDDDIEIKAQGNALKVSGRIQKKDSAETNFLYRGIATRSFERTFSLADHVKVMDAGLEHGLLHIQLVRELPEEARERIIPIGTGNGVIEAKTKK